MKKQIFNILTIVAIGFAVVACKDKAKEANTSDAETATVAESTSTKYSVSVDNSMIEWKGFKTGGSHNGTIALENGVFTTNKGNIESGTFLIDMKSIAVTDIPVEEKANANLVGHLSNPDFFDVEKFPSAAFNVTGMEGNILSGNLAIKGIKNNISFPVTVSSDGDSMTLASEAFTIDRSKWDIKYKSKSFFENLGDKFINDDIEMKITIKATKS